MTELIKTDLGTLNGVGIGLQRAGQVGSHTATATVVGSGSVSATVLIKGSNDGLSWTTLSTITASGTGTGTGTGKWTDDYALIRKEVTSLTGTLVATQVVTDQSAGGAGGQAVGGGGGMEVFRDMLMRGVPKRRPFLQQRHIIDYPTWTNGMTVAKGTTVKVAISGVNQLFTWLGDGGTATFASTTAPSVINSWRPQAVAEVAGSGSDSKGWVYMGPERRDLALAAELTYTIQNTIPAGTVNIGAWNAASPLRQVGDIENLDQASWVKVQSGDAIEGRTGYKRTDGTQAVGVSSIAFYTDADIVSWAMQPDADNYIDGNFEVDDVPYAFTSSGATNINTNRVRVITFNTRRRRLIRIRNIGVIMGSIYLRAGEQIEPITDALAQKILWTGDSYQAGAAPGPITIYGAPAYQAARGLGLPYFFLAAIGGRGYVATGGAGNCDLIDMLLLDDAKHKAQKYKAGFVCMTGNDNAVVSNAELVAAYVQVLQMYRSYMAYTDSPIFVCTRFNGFALAGSTEAADMNALMDQALAQVNDPYVFKIRMGTDRSTGKALLNDTNVASYIGSVDIHPFDGGHRFYADFVSAEVLRIMGVS